MQEEVNLVDIWLKKDPTRWTAGVFAGLFAGLVMMTFSMILAFSFGMEIWYPVKIPAMIVLGASALEFGTNLTVMLTGLLVHEALCAFLGVVYAHFTGTNVLAALLGVGLTWGAFSWIFIGNLFSPSFRDIYVAQLPAGATFFSWMVFGLSLTSVAFFDKILRK